MSAAKSTAHPQPGQLAAMFQDVVLVLGGVFATRGTDGETIRRVATGLERIYRRARGEQVFVRFCEWIATALARMRFYTYPSGDWCAHQQATCF